MNTGTLFSVIIPAYNAEKVLGPTIESVLAQTYKDYEVVIVDDGSTDRTPQLLSSFGERIRSIRRPNQGAESARHHAASAARGQYLVLLDHDDLLLPWALATYARIIAELEAPPLILAAMCEFETGRPMPAIDHDIATIEVWKYVNLYRRERPPASSCSQLVIKKSVAFASNALHNEPTAFPFDTADILLSLGIYGPCVAVSHPITVAYRLHESNTIRNLRFMVETAPCLIRLERKGRYPGGRKHQFARQAYIGGVEIAWCRRALGSRRPDLAAKLMLQSAPFVAVAILRKLGRQFRRPSPPIRLPEQPAMAGSGTSSGSPVPPGKMS